jgi:hypothetical protein
MRSLFKIKNFQPTFVFFLNNNNNNQVFIFIIKIYKGKFLKMK